jgi:hypothetical protein
MLQRDYAWAESRVREHLAALALGFAIVAQAFEL